MITIGYDIGTRFVKTCIVENDSMLGGSVREAGRDIDKAIVSARDAALEAAEAWLAKPKTSQVETAEDESS